MIDGCISHYQYEHAFTTPQGQGRSAQILSKMEKETAQHYLPPVPPPLDELDPKVAHQLLGHWYRPCEAMFELLAQRYPRELAKLISSEKLRPADLTFAAEALGRTPDAQLVQRTLLPLLRHTSPLVREGAIYGLAHCLNEAVRREILQIAQSDPSPGVRASAEDLLA